MHYQGRTFVKSGSFSWLSPALPRVVGAVVTNDLYIREIGKVDMNVASEMLS